MFATHNEIKLLYKTINACAHEYPDDLGLHIYVCDDTNRPRSCKLADELGVGYFGFGG